MREKDVMIDATGERSEPFDRPESVLLQRDPEGYELLVRNRIDQPNLRDPKAQKTVDEIRDELYSTDETVYKDYQDMRKRIEEVLYTCGNNYRLQTDYLIVRSVLSEPWDQLADEGEALLQTMKRHEEGIVPGGLAEVDGDLTPAQIAWQRGMLHNNVAYYAYKAGDLDRAMKHIEEAVAVTEATPTQSTRARIDRRYILAALLFEKAQLMFNETVELDVIEYESQTDRRLHRREAEYPILTSLKNAAAKPE